MSTSTNTILDSEQIMNLLKGDSGVAKHPCYLNKQEMIIGDSSSSSPNVSGIISFSLQNVLSNLISLQDAVLQIPFQVWDTAATVAGPGTNAFTAGSSICFKSGSSSLITGYSVVDAQGVTLVQENDIQAVLEVERLLINSYGCLQQNSATEQYATDTTNNSIVAQNLGMASKVAQFMANTTLQNGIIPFGKAQTYNGVISGTAQIPLSSLGSFWRKFTAAPLINQNLTFIFQVASSPNSQYFPFLADAATATGGISSAIVWSSPNSCSLLCHRVQLAEESLPFSQLLSKGYKRQIEFNQLNVYRMTNTTNTQIQQQIFSSLVGGQKLMIGALPTGTFASATVPLTYPGTSALTNVQVQSNNEFINELPVQNLFQGYHRLSEFYPLNGVYNPELGVFNENCAMNWNIYRTTKSVLMFDLSRQGKSISQTAPKNLTLIAVAPATGLDIVCAVWVKRILTIDASNSSTINTVSSA